MVASRWCRILNAAIYERVLAHSHCLLRPALTELSLGSSRARGGEAAGGEGGPRGERGGADFLFWFLLPGTRVSLTIVFPRAREGGRSAGGFDPAPPARSYRVGRRTTRSKPLAEAIWSKSAVIAVNRSTTPDRQVTCADRVDLFLRTNANNCSLPPRRTAVPARLFKPALLTPVRSC